MILSMNKAILLNVILLTSLSFSVNPNPIPSLKTLATQVLYREIQDLSRENINDLNEGIDAGVINTASLVIKDLKLKEKDLSGNYSERCHH